MDVANAKTLYQTKIDDDKILLRTGGGSDGIGNMQKSVKMKADGFNATRHGSASAQGVALGKDSPEQTDKKYFFKGARIMSKVFKKSYVMTALICMLIACLTCGTLVLTANAQEEEPTSTLTFTSYTSVMRVEEEFTFAALVTNEDGTTSTEVTWSSSNEDVIYIEEGLATALSEGNATITATAGELSASINVLVSDEAVLVTGVTLNSETRIVYMGETYQLEALVLPEDATDKNVTWKSSDESIATVDENGLVTAIAVGEADITVTTNDHMFTATCKIIVIDESYGV